MRKFQMSYLGPDGHAIHSEQIGPAIPAFEAAFSAFSHGTLIATPGGPVAVEDLVPGMKIATAETGAATLLWIGSMKLVPIAAATTTHDARMTRIMADSFGVGRPVQDFLAGPGARILARAGSAGEPAMMPVRDLSDGINVIDIVPPRPVTVYHLVLGRHATILANGLRAESFSPAPGFERDMGQKTLDLFLSLFPHIGTPEDFGPLARPRRPLVSPQGLEVA